MRNGCGNINDSNVLLRKEKLYGIIIDKKEDLFCISVPVLDRTDCIEIENNTANKIVGELHVWRDRDELIPTITMGLYS